MSNKSSRQRKRWRNWRNELGWRGNAWQAYEAIKITYLPHTIEEVGVNAEWPSEEAIRSAQDLLTARLVIVPISEIGAFC